MQILPRRLQGRSKNVYTILVPNDMERGHLRDKPVDDIVILK
jgi:hypothetical protein